MGAIYRETFTKPLPAGAEIVVRKGVRLARWKDSKGRQRTATVREINGNDRIIVTATTFTAKYRDGSGVVRKVATGCRDETTARQLLAELVKRAERVKSNMLTTAEDTMVDHLAVPIGGHFRA